VLARIASGWLAEASIWSNFRRATDGRYLDVARRQAVRTSVASVARLRFGPPEWTARTRLAVRFAKESGTR
jgi:hypothetical protein